MEKTLEHAVIRNGVNVAHCPWFIESENASDVFECFNDELQEYVCSSNKCKYKEYIKDKHEVEKKKEAVKMCAAQLELALNNDSCSYNDLIDEVSNVQQLLYRMFE